MWGQLERALDAGPPSQGLSAEDNRDPASPIPEMIGLWELGDGPVIK